LNFPVGKVISKAPLPVKFEIIFQELNNYNFNGYIVQSVKGNCIEEGALFFRGGEIVACIVECMTLKQTFKSDQAIEYFFNQTKGEGFFQAVELSRSQVDLVTAFDEKILITNKISLKDLPKLIPDSFEAKFLIQNEKDDLLGRFGLNVLKNQKN